MKNNRQKKGFDAFATSIVLHLILFGLLILGSFYTTVEIMGGGEGEGDVIGAVMVDTGSAAQEYGRLQQQKKGQTDKSKTQPEPKEQEKPKENVEKQQLEKQKQEQERQKQEKARQEALEQQKKAEEAKAKEAAEAARLTKEAEAKRLAVAAKQAEEEAKAKAAEQQKLKEAKEKAEKEAKEKAAKEAKAKADAEAKAKRQAEQAALDDFMNGGDIGGGSASKGGNANKQGSQGSGAGMGAGDGGKVGDQYAGVIKKEIQRRFLKDPSFAGKVCRIQIWLERDGTISNYQRISGPDDICGAALAAVARTKKVPAAPSDAVYNKYKSPVIDFDIK
ncbi:MAG: cell envelope integrity protein TolA [Lonepinella koalarum]|nr:cell envelope integrity protein TolA [Lonepinella koalarum]